MLGAQDAYCEADGAFTGEVSVAMLDLKMPGMDGWHVLEALRAIKSDLPVLICSGYDPDERPAEDLPEHVLFLSKPFRAAELQAALDKLMGDEPHPDGNQVEPA